ncbi:hypothetical protein MRX96_007612 [Rhipicephalus microplus]
MFRRHLDHIKPNVDQARAEDRMPSGNGKQGETTWQATVPALYMLDPTADSPVSSSFSLTKEPGPQEPVTQLNTTTASRPQRHRQLPDCYGDSIQEGRDVTFYKPCIAIFGKWPYCRSWSCNDRLPVNPPAGWSESNIGLWFPFKRDAAACAFRRQALFCKNKADCT